MSTKGLVAPGVREPETKVLGIDQLFSFYQVSTQAELILAMEKHIEKLQAKVLALTPPLPTYSKVRF